MSISIPRPLKASFYEPSLPRLPFFERTASKLSFNYKERRDESQPYFFICYLIIHFPPFQSEYMLYVDASIYIHIGICIAHCFLS